MCKKYFYALLFIPFSCSFIFAQDLFINEFQASNSQTISDNFDEYDDWIELYNASDSTINLTGIFISDDFDNLNKWQFPDSLDSLSVLDSLIILPKSYKILWADDQVSQGVNHLGFKLSANNEQIILSHGDTSNIIDVIEYDQQYLDISFGRHPDSTELWSYFDEATPGFKNSDRFFSERNDPAQISLESGYFDQPISVEIFNDDTNAVILYTTNSSIPTDSNAFIYDGPIEINSTTIIRAVTKKGGFV